MKIAISGKGGVGKTTLVAFLARAFRDRGLRVLAVDADPSPNLGGALGFPDPNNITPISELKELIAERTGATPGAMGTFFKLNPKVNDIPEAVCREHEGIKLLVMGTVKSGGSGCICPESAVLKALLQHLFLERDELVILDMEAGVEHLGRGTATKVDELIVVVEPGQRSIDTAKKIRALAADIGLKKISIVGNKIRKEKDIEFLRKNLSDFSILGFLPYNEEIVEADQRSLPPHKKAPDIAEVIEQIVEKICST